MIYVLSSPDGLPPLDDLAKVCGHPAVTGFQIRLKGASSVTMTQAVTAVQPLCRGQNVALILNDDPLLAKALGCDGVHVGEDDMPVAKARSAMGPGAIIGASCYDDITLAIQAKDEGASYVAFGAVYPTTTKQAKTRAPLSLFGSWKKTPLPLPSVAIGGISLDTVPQILDAGATGVALCRGIWSDVTGALRQMDILMNEYGDRRWTLTPTT
jgi:thiamine-phosphate pyrophosphorylase